MATLTFGEAMRQVRAEGVAALTALIRASAQDIEQDASTPIGAGGRMPIDTSFLRNSVIVTLDGSSPPPTGLGLTREQRIGALGSPNTPLALAQAEIGDLIMITWTAFYASFVEQNAFFVRAAVEKWDAIVENNARAIAQRGR